MTTQSDQEFISKAHRIVEVATERKVVLRLLGAIAFRIHSLRFEYLHKTLGRSISDMDFMGYGKQKNDIEKVFASLGYMKRPPSLTTAYSYRDIYLETNGNLVIDVFFDKLQMCHTIDFRNRLELDSPTIPLADMLLQKLQIVQLNEKDVKDVLVLLREHSVGEGEKEIVNMPYITKLLSDDWGFYYTVTTNLRKVKDLAENHSALTEEDKKDIDAKIGQLLSATENEPKSFSWKMRARVGTSKKWYREVEVTSA